MTVDRGVNEIFDRNRTVYHDTKLEAAFEHIDEHHQHLFYLKARDWPYAREVRFVVALRADQDFVIDPMDALSGVISGSEFPEIHESTLMRCLRESEVHAYRRRWIDGVPRLYSLAHST